MYTNNLLKQFPCSERILQMTSKTTRKPTKTEKLRERVEHLSVDLEYSSREGNSAYTQLVNKRLNRLYNILERIQDVRNG